MSTRRCPRCQTSYAAPARYCVKDGSPLVDVEPAAAFAPRPEPPLTGVLVEDLTITPEELDHCATLSGKLLDGRYQVGRRLGEGGMSFVYLAKDVASDDRYAIKVTPRKLRLRLH